MSMDLNEIAVFIKVIEAGSFAGAANILDMPKSTVSAKVSALERRLGVTLIQRTTRKLHITDTGKEYYEKCVIALEQITSAEEQATQKQSIPQGLLRITAPVELGGILLPEVMTEFQKQFPLVNSEFILTDRNVDLVAEGIDVGIRAGNLKDSTLIAKKIGSVYFALYASSKYLKANGTPKSPKDLKNHRCIVFSALGSQGWQLNGPSSSQTVQLNQSLVANDLNLVKSMAKEGLGIALLPTFFCFHEANDKSLVRILDDWKSNVRPVHFIYPQQQFVPKNLSAFMSIGTDIIRRNLLRYGA